MTTSFLIWYKRFMILCLAVAIGDLIFVGVAHVLRGEPMTHALTMAVWAGVLVIMVAGSSLLKLRQLNRFIKKPD